MIELEQKEIAFLKGMLGTDYAKQMFGSIWGKFISDLKDIEGLDRTNKDFNKQIEFKLMVVDKLKEIMDKMLILSEDINSSKHRPI